MSNQLRPSPDVTEVPGLAYYSPIPERIKPTACPQHPPGPLDALDQMFGYFTAAAAVV